MAVLSLKIENLNNKLNADCFLHLWTTLGSFDGNDLIHEHEFKINDLPQVFKIHDIGKCSFKELPAWMGIMSHNLPKKDLKSYLKVNDDQVIYFVIFRVVG